MATMKSSGDLIASISADLADNNAGLISAEDVRHNMEDISFSINRIVASGNTNKQFPFYHNVRARQNSAGDANSGKFLAESGIEFVTNHPGSVQTEPFLGVGSLDHNSLANLTVGNVHTQYYKTDGTNVCTDDFKLGNNWINASGYENIGFKFVPSNGHEQEIYTSGTMRWGDNSIMPNAKGVAKAWINLNTSGDVTGFINLPYVRSWHNISQVVRDAPGKFTVIFESGTFINNEYVAVGTANARSTAAFGHEDFDVNTVGIITRSGNDDNISLRQCKIGIKNDAGQFSDSERVDIAFYGYSPLETSGTLPTVTLSPTYTES